MAVCAFAYDELVICRQCGSNDFSLFKSLSRLRCNNCKTSYSEHELVEEAVDTMSDYIRNHGITERLPLLAAGDAQEYSETSTLGALMAAWQLLSYPQSATPETIFRAQKMIQAAIKRESLHLY